MKIAIIICTYMRPDPLAALLGSIQEQTHYPDQILIIDGSTNDATQIRFGASPIKNLAYHKVPDVHRGLTRQRNYGIALVDDDIDIVAFLDDDTILQTEYVKCLITSYINLPNAAGIGGIAINENAYNKMDDNKQYATWRYFTIDGYVRKRPLRNIIRYLLGLDSHMQPGVMPQYSHGSTYNYPMSGKAYPVDLLIGMSMSFRKTVVENLKFSEYFHGYGLYEDADFSLRALKYGDNYIDTTVQLEHYHAASGRPNQYQYGKMVVRNGWYVWRVKYPSPSFKNRIKWHSITLLLTGIRFMNIFTTSKRTQSFTEFIGRCIGWMSLFVNTPK